MQAGANRNEKKAAPGLPRPGEILAESPDLEQLYRTYRPYAFMVAYRMLGSVTDAEDIVQEWFAEIYSKPLTGIENWRAYLAKSITNRCLNLMNSAPRRRENYVGEWLPEPLPVSYTAFANSPYEAVEQADTLSYAYLVMLEKLTAVERAVLVLREMFEYGYDVIAEIMNKSEASCRKILSRAKQRLDGVRSSLEGYRPSAVGVSTEIMSRFVNAVLHYDVGAMMELLAQDAVLVSDGGGRVRAAINPIISRERVVALITSQRAFRKLRIWEMCLMDTYTGQSLVYYEEGTARAVITLEPTSDGERIQRVYIVVNPDKLAHIRV